jgi:hypothetical protein
MYVHTEGEKWMLVLLGHGQTDARCQLLVVGSKSERCSVLEYTEVLEVHRASRLKV